MMAAAQPFISGAISKTINLPNEATVADIQDSYEMSWELGLKANALYRDGCKLSQPLNNKATDEDEEADDPEAVEAALEEVADEVVAIAAQPQVRTVERVVEKVVERPMRRRLPDTRMSRTHKFNVAGHEGYLTVGLYEDGQPGELFITMAKEGSTIGGLMDSLGTAISVALQYGVPTSSLVTKFSHQRFEPAGMTHNRDIPFAKSLVDYIFRWMGMEFVAGYREANAPQRSSEKPASATPINPPAALADPAQTDKSSGADPLRARASAAAAEPVPSPAAGDGQRVWGFGSAKKSSVAEPAAPRAADPASASADGASSTLTEAMGSMQADAPACDVCGTITVRNGTCYKCLNCGNSMGCS
jgi:ribonucleoside-diphosphate reductase alpha chain